MTYQHTKKLSRKEIDLFKKMTGIREILYLGTRLVDEECEYEPEKVAEYAIKKGYASRLGYLAETSLEAAKNTGLEQNLARVEKLISLLTPSNNTEYKFLAPWKNYGYDKKVLRELDKRRSTYELNAKWKIYSAVHSSDIRDYIQLYLIDMKQENNIQVRSLVQSEMSEDQLIKNFEEFIELVYT